MAHKVSCCVSFRRGASCFCFSWLLILFILHTEGAAADTMQWSRGAGSSPPTPQVRTCVFFFCSSSAGSGSPGRAVGVDVGAS
jgi:hypothetical protein